MVNGSFLLSISSMGRLR